MTKLTVLLTLAAISCGAQDWARQKLEKSPRHREWVTISARATPSWSATHSGEHGGRALETFVVYPEVKGKAPVILIIHEIFGMTDWVQEVADEFAEAGYIAIAPDLLSGMSPSGKGTSTFPAGEATKAVSGLDADQTTADLNAVADYARKIQSAGDRLYVVGFCWGGGQSFRFATNRPDLAAAFVFYGPPPAVEAMARIQAPVYGFYGENDARISATIPATEKAMKEAGKKYDPVIYPGAGHGFMRAGEAPEATEANAKARAEAWTRLKKLIGN
jgi:carboxymethylenebutenolidase